jgi:hypothetical protein
MIINVPTGEDYTRTGLDQLNLAWREVVELTELIGIADSEGDETDNERHKRNQEFWKAANRKVANGVALTHQALEFLLKGRIAAISPYLLIQNDPRDWPKPDGRNTIEFSRFKTLDAVHLPKICTAVSSEELPTEMSVHYDYLRKARNTVMHSVGGSAITGSELFALVLKSYKLLFPESSWFKERKRHLQNDEHSILFSSDSVYFRLIQEGLDAIDSLSDNDCLSLIGLDKAKTRYLCPSCDSESSHYIGKDAFLCQFSKDGLGQDLLKCCVCLSEFPVVRRSCRMKGCNGDVIWPEDEMCLLCGKSQPDSDDAE